MMKPEIKKRLTPYEQEVWLEIFDFKNPDKGWLNSVSNAVHKPVDALGKKAFDTRIGEIVESAMSIVVEKMNDAATWSLRENAILDDFDKDQVKHFSEIQTLSLERVEDIIGNLGRKYRTIAAIEGTAAGFVGAPGMVIDIPLILTIAMRGVTETAAYYGHHPVNDDEKTFAMNVVATASAPTPALRRESLIELTKHSSELVGNKASAATVLSIQFVERVMESIVARMARGKVAQVVPLVGSLIGGGFNRWFVAQVMETSQMMYRERFLVEKHGREVGVPIEQSE